jgi:hypothetical protein
MIQGIGRYLHFVWTARGGNRFFYAKVDPWKMLGYDTPDVIEPRPVFRDSVTSIRDHNPHASSVRPLSSVHIAYDASGSVLIDAPARLRYTVEVTDCAGRMRYSTSTVEKGACRIPLLSQYGAGVYFVSVRNDDLSVVKRMVIR